MTLRSPSSYVIMRNYGKRTQARVACGMIKIFNETFSLDDHDRERLFDDLIGPLSLYTVILEYTSRRGNTWSDKERKIKRDRERKSEREREHKFFYLPERAFALLRTNRCFPLRKNESKGIRNYEA